MSRSVVGRWAGAAARVAATSLVLLFAAVPQRAEAQFSDPCGVECGLVLGATSFVFASGVATAIGRMNGGFTTTSAGIVSWTGGFVVALGGGIALAGNGERQERAIYSAGLGLAAGSLVGLATESLAGGSTTSSRWASTLIGAAAGALTFGVYGALTWESESIATPVASFSIPVGF